MLKSTETKKMSVVWQQRIAAEMNKPKLNEKKLKVMFEQKRLAIASETRPWRLLGKMN